MNKQQIRQRFIATGVEVREGEGDSRVLKGKAVCFNEVTTLWDGKYYVEKEIISPSCITEEFLREQDVKLNLLHNRNESIARNNKGVGTLKFELREDGLYWEAEMPKCDLGDRALELVRNKTYTGCSFEFYPEEYTEAVTTLADGREEETVTHTKFRSLSAITIALDPAYQGTSVSEREAYQKRENERDAELAKREAEKKAEQERLTLARESADRQRRLRLLEMETNI